jgi:cytochrome c oxidase cbb3-type subunit 3
MPAFRSLSSSDTKAVVGYVRTLQGARQVVKLPGNSGRGKTLFFGKAECSQCHMVGGKGGFIASDLSGYARTHDVEQIRSAITNPATITDRQARLIIATSHGGEKYVGRIRNEDNFSLQLQTLDGAFHFISKSDLDGLESDPNGLMPSGYGTSLTVTELDDVISFLISAANASRPVATRKSNEEE